MISYPKQTDTNWSKLSKEYLEKSVCENIFPKLPSMCNQYFGTWKTNNLVQSAMKRMSTQYSTLLERLASSRNETLELIENYSATLSRIMFKITYQLKYHQLMQPHRKNI